MKFQTIQLQIILFLMVAIFIPSCSLVKPVELKGVNSFQINEKTGVGVEVTTSLKLYNPNRFTITLNSTDVDVLIEGIKLGKLETHDPIEIPAKQVFNGEFKITIGLANLLTVGRSLFVKVKSGSFQVAFKGTVNSSFRNITKEITLDTVQNVQMN